MNEKYDQTVNHFAQIYYVYVNHCVMSNIHPFFTVTVCYSELSAVTSMLLVAYKV